MKQDKATTSIPVQKIKDAVYNTYSKKGLAAAYEVADKYNVDYDYCKGCECASPSIDHECLICGQKTKDATPSPSIPVNDELDMTKGEWVPLNSNYSLVGTTGINHAHVCQVYGYSGLNGSPEMDAVIRKANAKAICTAVNETYGKGYNPAAMEELYKALEAAFDTLYWYKTDGMDSLDERLKFAENDDQIQDIKTALKNAKTIKP